MPKVTTTLWPDQAIEVDESEEADLRAQGLLIEDKKSSKKKED